MLSVIGRMVHFIFASFFRAKRGSSIYCVRSFSRYFRWVWLFGMVVRYGCSDSLFGTRIVVRCRCSVSLFVNVVRNRSVSLLGCIPHDVSSLLVRFVVVSY